MKNCPACKAKTADDALECSWCGVIFSKWEERHKPPAEAAPPPDPTQTAELPADAPAPEPPPEPPASGGTFPAGPSRLKVALFAFFGNILLWVLVFQFKPVSFSPGANQSSRTDQALDSTESPTGELGEGDEWSREVKLKGSPQGLTWNGEEFLIGNRKAPGGLLRLGLDGNQRQVDVVEPAYRQKISFWALAWNGTHYVGYVDGAWFQQNNTYLFAVLDPKTLAVLKTYPAPNLLGALTWDGTSYWAATRRNTRDSGEPAFIYQLDAEFNVIQRLEPPAFGCQGLAWVNDTLWWVDVFTDELYILKPELGAVRKLHAYDTGMDYLSGIAFDGANVWVSTYQDDRLVRLPTRLTRAFLNGDHRVRHHALVEVCRSLMAYTYGSEDALNALLNKMGGSVLAPERVHEAVEAMVSLDAKEPLVQAMNLALSREEYSQNHAVIRQELERLQGAERPVGVETPLETPAGIPAETPAGASAVIPPVTPTSTP